MNEIVMPTALDAERAVIGAMLIEPEAYAKVMNILNEGDFYDAKNRAIFKAISNLALSDQDVDIITVKTAIEKDDLLPGENIPFLVASISSEVVSSAHIVTHAMIVSEVAKKRRTIEVAERTKKDVLSGKDIGDVLEELGYTVEDLAKVGVTSNFEHINTYISEAFQEIQAASKNPDGISGVPCGFEDLDRVTAGFQKSDLIIIGGRPAMGKTALLMSMVYNMSVRNNIKTGVFSLEMSGTQLTKRLISLASEVEGSKLRSGQLSPHEFQSLDASIASIYDSPVYIDDTAEITLLGIKSRAKEMVEQHGVEVVFIDYIQLVNSKGRGNRQEEVAVVSRGLKAMAKELDIPVVVLSQVSRKVADRDG
ncbi:MAG: replicative DNA helicase, partial [Bacteroides sp.]